MPMTMSILPSSRPSLVAFASAAGTRRDRRPISIGKPWKRSPKLSIMLAGEQGGRRDQRDLLARPSRRRRRRAARPRSCRSRRRRRPAGPSACPRRDRRARRRSRGPGRRSPHRGSGRRRRDSRCRARRPRRGASARSAAVLISSPAISRIRSFIRDLRRCQASPPSRSSVTPSLSAAVAREDVDILDRDVELVAAGIVERDAIVRRLADRDLGQPLVAADAVIGVDDEVARA